jgi:signal transduction histidine kinase/DNA-binding NarL/FixJ family response regulator/HPt (histidine-containing phosphotransfer) domain-containing protein
MSSADATRLVRLVESLQRENEQLRQRATTESHSRIMAEDALDKTQDRLQLALDASGLATWEWNLVDDSLLTSARFTGIMEGMPDGQASDRLWRSKDFLSKVLAQDHSAIQQAIVDVLKQRQPRLDVEFRTEVAAGTLWIECLGEVVQRSMLGQAEIMVGVIRDVTRRRLAQQEIEAARAEAVAANAAKDEFLAHMSHEIRTPLNGVMGMNNLLAQTTLTAEQRQYVDLVGSSGQALLALVNDLLDYSRLQAHKLVLEHVRFPLRRWLWEVVEPQRLAAQAKGLELQLQVDDKLPQEMVGDPGRLRQIVVNLLTNAIKFTDHGRIDISMQWVDGVEHQAVQLEVRDTGIGIAAEKQQLVFAAFAQADSSTARRFGGTGLGLSICERLVGLMGGHMELASTPGQGSCFTVLVPLAKAHGDIPITQFGLEGFGASQLPADAKTAVASASVSPAFAGRRALVVDDHSVNQLLASKLLQTLGMDVQAVADGERALQTVQEGQCDVVLMDIQMPGMDGWQATRLIRQWELAQAAGRIPIIALTAHASAADREKSLACGMDGYLTKPVSIEALAGALEKLKLGHTPVQAAGQLAKAVLMPVQSAPSTRTPAVGGDMANRARLLARVGGDEALLREMAKAFCVDLRERMGRAHAAVQKQDWPGIIAQAHALNGALLTMTALGAAQEAKAMEQAAQSQDKAGTQASFAKLSSAAKIAYDTIKAW